MAKILFIDESGDHSLTNIDPQYPIFTLCGVIIDSDYHQNVASPRANDFKNALFGTSEIILHTADFTRNREGFEAMAQHDFRLRFFAGLENLIAGLDFLIVACVIKKSEHFQKYGLNALDPYFLSLSLLVERFVFECGSAGGTIVAEARDATLNHALEIAFLNLKISGTQYVSAARIQRCIHNFAIRDKRENITGLQIADAVATPIGRHAIGRATYPAYCGQRDFYSVVERKFRRTRDGKIEGMGLIVLPK